MSEKMTPEINYVTIQHFWADAYKRESAAQQTVWPQKYGFIVEEYRKMNEQLDKGKRKPLPAKALCVKEEDFRQFDPDPEKKQPVPKTQTKQYGWNIGPGQNRLEYLDTLTRPAPRVNINNQLGWPWGAQG